MIITECPYCDESHMVPLQDEFLFRFRRMNCDKCGGLMFVEMRRIGGRTFSKEAFIEAGGNYTEE